MNKTPQRKQKSSPRSRPSAGRSRGSSRASTPGKDKTQSKKKSQPQAATASASPAKRAGAANSQAAAASATATSTGTATVAARSDQTAGGGVRFNYRRATAHSAMLQQSSHQRRHAPARRWKLVRLANHGRIDVVGESNYQSALIEITGRRDWSEVQHECMAILILEPRNPHDPNAVRVEIKRRKVGYLSRADAISYGPYLRRLARHGKLPCCEALISGRGKGPETKTKNMGVFLFVSPPGPELLATT